MQMLKKLLIYQIGFFKLMNGSNANEYPDINIPKEHLLYNRGDTIKTIVEITFLNLMANYQNLEFLQTKAILASTVNIAYEINDTCNYTSDNVILLGHSNTDTVLE